MAESAGRILPPEIKQRLETISTRIVLMSLLGIVASDRRNIDEANDFIRKIKAVADATLVSSRSNSIEDDIIDYMRKDIEDIFEAVKINPVG